MTRLLALIIVLIPGILAVIGVKLMRDSAFSIENWPFTNVWLQFAFGLFLFIMGLAFIGGFIYRRDKKRKKVTKRFKHR
ncbi:DUF2627 domain-containing protein [Caldibacillus lycopersici]|uniref:DUF2627 domain-containing protein n=1 Tax=Perspicuibacillus lycopersici TaxID=1325689 RepID=A0AAE3ISJ1_9BACI|nr:DUF2627 domain-containing protein [Perspicuibacillus lycopersici]MCU9613820.1 DUF2627 domain-containing protein [Perspicuibacillus lycopersici]